MPNSMTRKRRHHYVWRRYLKPWAQDEKIFALISGKIANPNLMGVAQKRDFYEFSPVTEEDIIFIRMLVVERAMPDLRALHEDTLALYLSMQRAILIADKHAGRNDELDKSTAALKSNFVEDWHGTIEKLADQHLDMLSRGCVDFYEDKINCIDFATFLATQYLRTNKRKADILSLPTPIPRGTVERTWTLLVHMLATNIAWHLFVSRTENTLKVLINQTEQDFITSDQPVINVLALGNQVGSIPEQLEFYYPITPKIAVFLGKHNKFPGTEADATPQLVDWLNEQIFLQSESQVFAREKQTLLPYLARYK